MVQSAQLSLIRVSFQRLRCRADVLALDFYDRLFAAAPHLRALFGADLDKQARKLGALLSELVDAADPMATYGPALVDLGRAHRGYGVRTEHYDLVGTALLAALASNVHGWTDEMEAAWAAIFTAVAATMLQGAASDAA